VIQAGDKLMFRQFQTSGTRAGMILAFTDSTYSYTNDQDGWTMSADGFVPVFAEREMAGRVAHPSPRLLFLSMSTPHAAMIPSPHCTPQ
jgi:hypothetical protein